MSKLLVLYVYHIYNERVEQFINKCIFKDDSVDFIVISNDKNNDPLCLPDYVKTFYRDNIGYDFGGWSDALLTDNLYENYDKFIFVNSSVIGPFIPSYFIGKWTDIYVNGLKENVKLFGSTINDVWDPVNKSHVQSYIFSMDKETLEYLINCNIFSRNYVSTFRSAIWEKEVLMSRKVIENGWNIGSLLPIYQNIDFTNLDSSAIEKMNRYYSNHNGDFMYNDYRNKYWNEYQLVFIKGNRDIHI
jgi:hypothetical protein